VKHMKSKVIKVNTLARVEGEGALEIRIQENRVVDVKLRIYEPPRFFEAFLRGRDCREAPDVTARICGICPVAYQMSAVHAIENALDVRVQGQLRSLRRLLYCGEWIESHVLHVAMLHAPDFLGYADAFQMARDHPTLVQNALKLKKTGNAIVSLLGGREIHPINVKVGGFYRVPQRSELIPLVEQLKSARDIALEIVSWTGTLPFPEFEQDYEFVALSHPNEYPFNEGLLTSNRGLNIEIKDYDSAFVEEHIEHSNALHSVLKARGPYFVGPLARYNLNFSKLPPLVQDAAKAAGLSAKCRNPFQSIIVRSLETLYACEEALRIIEQYERPEQPAVEFQPRAGIGYGCTEAPRGILYHRYTLDANGMITDAKIVPPTSQNQKTIENDLRELVPKIMDLPNEKLTWQCEQAIRNYDPCISCATHFLKVNVVRD
jgi:coenzyme F420-reducing hydrogenase alpha subunit